MSKPKIFVVYHKPAHVFKNEVFEPIQTGANFSGIDLGFLKDNTGDNIAHKNQNYGELTAWYWVWKNWLPAHPEIAHVGFCHYRRFLDVNEPLNFHEDSYRACTTEEFVKRFKSGSYTEEAIFSGIGDSDLILPTKLNVMSFEGNFRSGSLYDQYLQTHPYFDFIMAAELFAEFGNKKRLSAFWRGSSFHSCLNFIMRRNLFEEFCTWVFSFLSSLEKKCNWNDYTSYNEIRVPAFLIERYFDLWLAETNDKRKLNIKTCPRWVLDTHPVPHDFLWYLSGIKQLLMWKLGVYRHQPLAECLQ